MSSTRCQLWIAVFAGLIFFTNLGATGLWDMDEALYSTCAREMLQRNDWVVPWFNGAMFPEKPPLMFWNIMAGYGLFGINSEFGARFFSAVMGLATALAAFHLGRILFNLRVGLWAGLITASTLIFTISARAATADSPLALVTTLAFLWFVVGRDQGLGIKKTACGFATQGQSSPAWSIRFPCAVLMYACIGLGALAKGPVGVVLPIAALGAFLLFNDGWRNLPRAVWNMRPMTGILVLALVALPWYIEVGRRTDWVWPHQFLWKFNLRPFQTPILGHGDTSSFDRLLAALVSFLYYFYQIPAVLIGFFPWSVFLGPALVDAVRRLREKNGSEKMQASVILSAAKNLSRAGTLLAVCWFGAWFILWSVCKTKLSHYLLPAYPALALLTACFIDRWLSEPAGVARWALRNAWISMILVGVGIMIAVPFVTAVFLPGEWWIGSVGLILVLGGVFCWRATLHNQHRRAAVALAVTSALFLTAVFGFAAIRVDRFQNARPMIAAIRADEAKKGSELFSWKPGSKNSSDPFLSAPFSPIATYRFFRESTVFYARHQVTVCDDDPATKRSAQESLAEFLAKSKSSSKRSYVITTNEYEQEIMQTFPNQFTPIFRQPRFLDPGEMVVLRYEEGKGAKPSSSPPKNGFGK